VDPQDLPPDLGWEAPVWTLYCRISSQWRVGFGGRVGLDYGVALPLIEKRGWKTELALDLLRAIESTYLELDENERERTRRH